MIGIYRLSADSCTLILGHQEITGTLDLAWSVGEALAKVTRSRPLLNKPGPAVCALIPGRKVAVEFDGVRLWLHNHDGTAPTHWHTVCVPEEIEAWASYFHFLVGLDTWDKETTPTVRAHMIPMRWAAANQLTGPYQPAWRLLRQLGLVPVGEKVPKNAFEAILGRCNVAGLKIIRRLHIV